MSTTPDTLQRILSAKSLQNHTFASLAALLPSRNEVSTASLLLSRHPPPSPDEIQILSSALYIPASTLIEYFSDTPDRGATALEMPPREPLMYRLYEAVMNYGKAYKAVMNEMFGDGIMSAIAFKTEVAKEVVVDPDTGAESTWAVIIMKGKWLPYAKF
ncbi:cyanate hydratase [Tirmania nivea]|nr:cyanate hydratase [Tirmania nivea]